MFSKHSSLSCSNQSSPDLNPWQYQLRLDQIKAKRHYDCFPEYPYNTAFGSLLTGSNYTDANSLIRNDEFALEEQHVIVLLLEKLVGFLDEFLVYLSSMISYEQFQSYLQLTKIKDIAERIYQLRLMLLAEIDRSPETIATFDISLILRELASLIHCLSEQQQQQTERCSDPSPNIIFSQLLNRLERILQSCMDCINRRCNPQCHQSIVPDASPCMNSIHTIDNPMSIPWSVLNQIESLGESDNVFGLVFGIKDEKVRRKLGYHGSKQKPASRSRCLSNKKKNQRSQKIFVHDEVSPIDNKYQKVTKSFKNRSSPSQPARLNITASRTSKRKTRQPSANSVSVHEPDSMSDSYTISPQQSIQLNSIYDRLMGSTSNERLSPRVEDLPASTLSNNSILRRTSSHLNEKQSSSYKNSKTETSNLSPALNKSVSINRSREMLQSETNVKDARNTSNTLQNDDEQNLSQINAGYVDSSARSVSKRNILYDENMSYKSSPLSMRSLKLTKNDLLKSSSIDPGLSNQQAVNESINRFYSYNSSNYQIPTSPNIQLATHTLADNISSFKVIEGPRSAEGEIKIRDTLTNENDEPLTPYVNSMSTHQQQSTSAIDEKNASSYVLQFPMKKQGYWRKFMSCIRRTIAK
ncbi:unnamed protein product [Adineta ricciae]|uniref:Uncharacterized protein n=1 Tax=Adineta ricciae TaxID=249248 RepID=A0A814E4F1_ADIRI|nr:unnamed protein product [Adineta ricciae]CAF0963694.1 unnamed protein product [Adineta ricciae]